MSDWQPKTADSADYTQTFYGIKSPYGNLWSPLPYPTEEDARAALRKFWRDDEAKFSGFKIVPVRVQLTEIVSEGGAA